MKAHRLWFVALLACLLVVSVVFGAAAKENVVQLPYFDNIPSFVPYYWQSQHILAQGTIFEGLFGYAPDPKGLGQVKIVPVIADKWTVSPDGKVWTITLRKDKKWSNGDPVTARDFEWTFKYMCDPSIPDVPLWAGPLQHIYNGWTCKAGGAPMDELGVKALDDYTIRFTLANSRFDFNCWLVVAGAMPLHRKTIEKWGNDWWKPGHFVGNGPYVPQSWVDRKEAVLVKNKHYVGTCGNVDKIVLKQFAASGGTTQIQAYQAGDIDGAWIQTVADYRFATTNATLKKVYHETPNDLFWAGYQISRGFDPVMDNLKLRQAFAMAIDRETLCKTVLNGRATPANMYWTKADAIGSKMKGIPFNVTQARKLLAEAGYPNGKGLPQLTFYVKSSPPMPEVEFIVDQWRKNLGVNVQIENLEAGVYDQQYVWANWTSTAKAGFTRITAPMNSIETGALDKNSVHTILFYDYPAKIRKQLYEMDQERTGFLTKEGGTTAAEWEPLLSRRDKTAADLKAIAAKEPSKYWVEELCTRKPVFVDQFDEIYANWKAAKTDKEKTEQWRLANRLLLDTERKVIEYNALGEASKKANRIRYEMVNSPFEKAMQLASQEMQLIQDTYWMVPLFMDKAQYVLRPNITGLMVYKFSWGPAFFNFKYMNVK
ncbi:MAG: peptide ABC transporter substrate-binding protein [Bacteroidota bacterium]